MFAADVKVNQHQIEWVGKKLHDTAVAKVNTLLRPDGEKKAHIWLAPGYDAVDAITGII